MDLHYIIFFTGDLFFIGHHLANLFIFVTCWYLISHGTFSILFLLILAEVTSFYQNMWMLANARRGNVEFAAKVYDLLSPPFYALYLVACGFMRPYFIPNGLVFLERHSRWCDSQCSEQEILQLQCLTKSTFNILRMKSMIN
ncbi:hypothetical protein TorRG33x02_154170 [Trema orientale]|uniref:TLC domain-containing protein n=1 Tax=Trema orientale TaxID=63057 RepID=A0A2P5ET36_TREOI|nr:hypothetical protein TorRG33x02_154170 [Trema orientale]